MRRTKLITLLPAVAIAMLALSGATASAAGVCSSSTPQYCPAPVVVTGTATSVTTTSATLGGTVNPGGAATSCAFVYGTTTNYGKVSSVLTIPAGTTTTVAVSEPVSGLSPKTTYHFELVCGNAGAYGFGGDKTFTTKTTTKRKPPRSWPKLKTRKATVSKKGVVKLKVNCSNSTACKGKLSMTLKKKSLGKNASYSIKGKKSKTVSFKLSKKALKQLKKAKHHREKVRLKLKDKDKGSSSATVTLTFK